MASVCFPMDCRKLLSVMQIRKLCFIIVTGAAKFTVFVSGPQKVQQSVILAGKLKHQQKTKDVLFCFLLQATKQRAKHVFRNTQIFVDNQSTGGLEMKLVMLLMSNSY